MRAAPGERLRIVVFGLMGSLPVAGLIAHYLQYLLGLRRLGHDVLYVEDTGWFYDPWRNVYVDEWNGNSVPQSRHPARRLAALMHRYGFDEHWTWVEVDGTDLGRAGHDLERFLADADLLVHVTGAARMRDRYLDIGRRAYVDTDPGYLQMRTATHGHEADLALLAQHTSHFTFAGNIHQAECTIPTLGYEWAPTRQPLDLRLWRPSPVPQEGAFTTVVKWAPYEPVEFEGRIYGMKDVEFEKFVDLPRRVDVPLELAMEGTPPVPVEALLDAGWKVADGPSTSRDLRSYRAYLRASRGEWTVAKHGYVATRSGWFSDRSASYLAMGRPVVLQSTGYERWLPTGEGLQSFDSADEAAAALESIVAAPERHARAARELVAAHFDARSVLADLVATAMR